MYKYYPDIYYHHAKVKFVIKGYNFIFYLPNVLNGQISVKYLLKW